MGLPPLFLCTAWPTTPPSWASLGRPLPIRPHSRGHGGSQIQSPALHGHAGLALPARYPAIEQSCLTACSPGWSGSHRTGASKGGPGSPPCLVGPLGASHVAAFCPLPEPSPTPPSSAIPPRYCSQPSLPGAQAPLQPDTAAPLTFLPILCHSRAYSTGQRWSLYPRKRCCSGPRLRAAAGTHSPSCGLVWGGGHQVLVSTINSHPSWLGWLPQSTPPGGKVRG